MNCKIIDSMNLTQRQLAKMDEAVTIAYACMLARVPCLLVGNPGTAKSHTLKIIAGQFGARDADWFYQSITAKTSPEKLFGGIIAEKMLEGVEEYNLAVGAATKKGNIFDEIYKSQHPAMMNALLNYTDETPTIYSGGKNISPEWQWLYATTNFEDLPETLTYDPLWDRFGAKVIVNALDKLDSKSALKSAMSKPKATEFKFVKWQELETARSQALKIQCDDAVIDAFYEQVLPILEKNFYVSQRKIHSIFAGKSGCPSLMQAIAYLDNCSSINQSHLAFTPYFCWQDASKLSETLKAVEQVATPHVLIVYRKMIASLEEFISKCTNGSYSDYRIAKADLNLKLEGVTPVIKAFEDSDRAMLPFAIRDKMRSLIKVECFAACNKLKITEETEQSDIPF